MIIAFMRREAKASVALDGETQSFPVANAYAFIRMPDGKLKSVLIYDPSLPEKYQPTPERLHPSWTNEEYQAMRDAHRY